MQLNGNNSNCYFAQFNNLGRLTICCELVCVYYYFLYNYTKYNITLYYYHNQSNPLNIKNCNNDIYEDIWNGNN